MRILHAAGTFFLAGLLLLATTAAVFADDSTSVHFAIGDWITAILPIVAFVLILLVTVGVAILLRFLPPWAQAFGTPMVQKEAVALAANAINWGVQAVAGATKGDVIDINVGSKVVATAAQQALDTWPKHVIDALGGTDGVKKWIVTQLEDHGVVLPTDSTAAQVLASPVVQAVSNPH